MVPATGPRYPSLVAQHIAVPPSDTIVGFPEQSKLMG